MSERPRAVDPFCCVVSARRPRRDVFVLLMMVRRYEPDAGLGTVISRMLPFVVPFWVAWLLVLSVFYGFDLNMGPGVGIRLD